MYAVRNSLTLRDTSALNIPLMISTVKARCSKPDNAEEAASHCNHCRHL